MLFFDACLENFAFLSDLDSIGLQFACVFLSSLDLECNIWCFLCGFYDELCSARVFSCVSDYCYIESC